MRFKASVSFGGFTWTKTNSANESTHATAGGGSGLHFNPNVATWILATRTAPGLFLPLSQLSIPGLNWRTPLRVWVYAVPNTTDNTEPGFNGTGMMVAICNSTSLTANDNYVVMASSWGSHAGSWEFDGQILAQRVQLRQFHTRHEHRAIGQRRHAA